jgi:hypothetical protein
VIHQLKTELEQKNELDLKLAKLESSIVNSVTTMHNQEKEDMINKLTHVNFLDVLVKINS